MNAREIKARLKAKGITQGDLRRRWKRPDGSDAPRSTISVLVNRKMVSKKLEKKLARALGVTLAKLRGHDGGTR